jgi:hypothetical protein
MSTTKSSRLDILLINLIRPFTTKRLETESCNCVGAVRYGIHEIPMLETCPPPCRPPNHQDCIVHKVVGDIRLLIRYLFQIHFINVFKAK